MFKIKRISRKLTIFKGFIAILIFTIVYYLFQLFTIRKLNTLVNDYDSFKYSRIEQEIKDLNNQKVLVNNYNNSLKHSLSSSFLLSSPNLNVDLLFHFKLIKLNKNDFDLKNTKQIKNKALIRGVHYTDSKKYEADSENYFTCLNSKEKISYDQLNDDYCDCNDGSDEPGTSACVNSIFYCGIQNDYLKNYYIASSRVNDNYCDCCDGSDEYDSKAKCKNVCDDKTSKIKEYNQMKNAANLLKKSYLIEGRSKNENLYGPDGIFYKLSQTCYSIHWTEFDYKVCPYMHVKQEKQGSETNLGSSTSLKFENSIWTIHMTNGDLKFCGKQRSSKILLKCGIKEELKHFEEPEKCFYVFHLNTPAAC